MAKQDRIDFRIDECVKEQFVLAAEACGMNLSSFLIAAAQEQVARTKLQLEPLQLSDRDRDAFLALLEQPPRPLPKSLERAQKRRHERIIDAE